jgi:precorrin-4 methylase
MAVAMLIAAIACASAVAGAEGSRRGRLYLVSTGTGDPENITLRAVDVIRNSQVVFCPDYVRKQFPDILSGKEFHDTSTLVHRTFMKKEGGREEALKEARRISGIVRKAVAEGKTVSVVDGGDPTVYGPNMWFMEVFEDLDPEIVPGVSSFNAANAALKKGVTSGETTRSVVLTNGLDIEKLAAARTSMVFFTMHVDVPKIVERLKPFYPPDTPVAVVDHAGFKGKEKVVRGTLGDIVEKTKGEKLSLYLVYVGDFLTRRYGIDLKEGGTSR